tara:strand:- start:324 stop:470 length:147 start_codon:yes stop_codon:yes gene_type:complete
MILKPGFRVVSTASVDEELELFQKEYPDAGIMDAWMPGKDVLQGINLG